MSDLQVRGPLPGGTGTASPFTSDITGAQRVGDAHGRYAEASRRGNCFFVSGAALAPTAYAGAGAGTPLVAVHNPAGSAKQLELIGISFAIKVVASAIGWTSLDMYAGLSAAITGTATIPTSTLSLTQSGAIGRGFVNAALTGSTAIGFVMPLASAFWGTSVGVGLASNWIDLGGLITLVPGNMVGIGMSVAPASQTHDIALFWEETPYLQ